MAEAKERVCPTCGKDLILVPERPDTGSCLVHGDFTFYDRMALEE